MGKYLIKNDGGKKPPYELINEFISNEFLKIWEIDVPEAVLCNINSKLISLGNYSNRHNLNYYKNSTFGLEWIDAIDVNLFTPLSREFLSRILNPLDIIRIGLFDEWVLNDDRKEGNFNLLLKIEGNNFKVVPIDHGMILMSLPYKELKPEYYMARSNDYLLLSKFARSVLKGLKRNQQFINNQKDYFYLCIENCEKSFYDIIKKNPFSNDLSEEDISSLYDYLFDQKKNNKVFIEHVNQLKR